MNDDDLSESRNEEEDDPEENNEEAIIPCDCIGAPVFIDSSTSSSLTRKFYLSYHTCHLTVTVGDCARIAIETENTDNDTSSAYLVSVTEPSSSSSASSSASTSAMAMTTTASTRNSHHHHHHHPSQSNHAFGQVLAVYEDDQNEVFIEVRWFKELKDLVPRNRKVLHPSSDLELIESDELDDIPAGAVQEVIELAGKASNSFFSRYLETTNRSLERVNPLTIFQRGMAMSHYQYAYSDQLPTLLSDQQQKRSCGSEGGDGGQEEMKSGGTEDCAVAIQRMHLSVVPDELTCREAEHELIYSFIRKGVEARYSKSALYLYGFPGTGKTACVHSALRSLRKEVADGTLTNFRYIEINCLKLKSPSDAYTQLWRGVSGYHVTAKKALQNLKEFFSGQTVTLPASREKDSAEDSQDSTMPIVCLLDEMDYLLTRDFKVMYNFFDWPLYRQSSLILLGIANTMNLPETLASRIASRSTCNITRLVFAPYSHEQVQRILQTRIAALHLPDFDDRAKEFLARKAAAFGSGDLRKALQLCKLVLEEYRRERAQGAATGGSLFFRLIKQVVDEYRQSPMIAMVQRSAAIDKAILLVACKHRRREAGSLEDQAAAFALSSQQLWQQLMDLLTKVQTDTFYQETGSSVLGEPAVGRVTLRQPPYAFFLLALRRLLAEDLLVSRTTYSTAGVPIELYSVNNNFSYADLLAALDQDPLGRFAVA